MAFFFFWLCCMACGILVPRPGIEPRPSAVKTWCPNHWAAEEIPCTYVLGQESGPQKPPCYSTDDIFSVKQTWVFWHSLNPSPPPPSPLVPSQDHDALGGHSCLRVITSLGSPKNSNPLQYACLENSMDRGTWWATDHGAAKSQT